MLVRGPEGACEIGSGLACALYSDELPHAFNGSRPVVSVSITISRMVRCHKKFTKKLRLQFDIDRLVTSKYMLIAKGVSR